MRFVFAAIAGLALAGCAPMLITPENSVKVTAPSSVGTERTYRNVLGALRECYPGGYTIETSYYPEAKEGEIDMSVITDGFRVDAAKFKVVPSGTGAVVTMLRRTRGHTDMDAALPAWIEGKDGGCPYGTRAQAPFPTHNPYATAPR